MSANLSVINVIKKNSSSRMECYSNYFRKHLCTGNLSRTVVIDDNLGQKNKSSAKAIH